eukprot:2477359-Prymnesium_polylepis.2
MRRRAAHERTLSAATHTGAAALGQVGRNCGHHLLSGRTEGGGAPIAEAAEEAGGSASKVDKEALICGVDSELCAACNGSAQR